jgi:hypothetical protein
MAAADNLSDESIAGDLADEVDLHDKLMKGLFQIGAAEPADIKMTTSSPKRPSVAP